MPLYFTEHGYFLNLTLCFTQQLIGHSVPLRIRQTAGAVTCFCPVDFLTTWLKPFCKDHVHHPAHSIYASCWCALFHNTHLPSLLVEVKLVQVLGLSCNTLGFLHTMMSPVHKKAPNKPKLLCTGVWFYSL